MEKMQEINKKIAKNLTSCRKAAGLTQAELAEKINYSDKSVSKWESGNGVPDIYTLMQLSELYGVTLDALVGDDIPTIKTKKKDLRWLIMLLSSGLVWLVATCIFVAIKLWFPTAAAWLVFIYAVMVNSILIIVYTGIWRMRMFNFASVSILIWSALACLYLTVYFVMQNMSRNTNGLWQLFIIGIPLQILEVLWCFFRFLFVKDREKNGNVKNQTIEKSENIEKKEF